MHEYQLTVGDWSCDGHEESTVVHIRVNKTQDEIAAAYTRACVDSGIQFHDEVAADYQDTSYPGEGLREYGVPHRFAVGDHVDGAVHLVELLMEFMKVADPTIEYEVQDYSKPDLVYALNNEQFGYGLF